MQYALPPREAMPKAKAAALKALELDPTLGKAHVSLAIVLLSYDWDFPAAEKEFKRAIELNPGYPSADSWYAVHLSAMGRLEEAIVELHRAKTATTRGSKSDLTSNWLTLRPATPLSQGHLAAAWLIQ